jgi:phosphatidylserine/phosphatidylglycerophosphate/cardiolipin synthase-like enzyme
MISGMRLVVVALALVLTVVLSLGLSLVAPGVRAQAPRVYEPEQSRPWAVYFSPGGGAAQAVVEAIGRAGHTVLVQASSLSSPQITKSLADAQQRGVKVEVILDRKHAKGRPSSADALMRDGVVVLIDRAHPANSNVMVIDAEVVLTGSFGFTLTADRESAENLLIIHAPTLAARYGENWQAHAAHSVRYTSTTP